MKFKKTIMGAAVAFGFLAVQAPAGAVIDYEVSSVRMGTLLLVRDGVYSPYCSAGMWYRDNNDTSDYWLVTAGHCQPVRNGAARDSLSGFNTAEWSNGQSLPLPGTPDAWQAPSPSSEFPDADIAILGPFSSQAASAIILDYRGSGNTLGAGPGGEGTWAATVDTADQLDALSMALPTPDDQEEEGQLWTGSENVALRQRVCKTGFFGGTGCGTVNDYDPDYDDGTYNSPMYFADTDGCGTVAGDSGGVVFQDPDTAGVSGQVSAYGILVGSFPTSENTDGRCFEDPTDVAFSYGFIPHWVVNRAYENRGLDLRPVNYTMQLD